MQPIDLTDTYLHLEAGPGVGVIDVDDDFWPTIDQREDLSSGRLVMASDMTDDWDTWEMHPNGDELILIASGSVRVHVEAPAGTDIATPLVVEAPHAILMPAGAWHTMDILEPARVITATWGEGTQGRAR